MSGDKLIDTDKTITTIMVWLPEYNITFSNSFFLTEKYLAIRPPFDLSNNKY